MFGRAISHGLPLVSQMSGSSSWYPSFSACRRRARARAQQALTLNVSYTSISARRLRVLAPGQQRGPTPGCG